MHRIASMLLVVLLLAGGCGFKLQGLAGTGLSGVDGYRVTAVFAEATRLALGGTVRIGQRTVGTVVDISAKDFTARVGMEIEEGVRLPAGTIARLELTSALGEAVVVLEPPDTQAGGELLGPDGVIPIEDTVTGPSIEDTLAAVGALVSGSGISQVRTIVTELNTALSGRTGQAREVLSGLTRTMTSLDEHSAAITSLIGSMNRLSTSLKENTATLQAAFTRIRPAIDVLLEQREEFSVLLDSVAALGESANGLVKEAGAQFVSQLKRLRPVLDDLRGIDTRFADTLGSLERFAGLMHKAAPGDYLLLDGTLDVPESVAELLTPQLPGGGGQGAGSNGFLLEGTR